MNTRTVRKGTDRKPDFLPLLASAFVERGYRRTTTADLAEACQVRENELYRIWPNKKAMFLDSIQFVFDASVKDWQAGIQSSRSLTAAEQLLDSQTANRGRGQLHRVVFSGLGEIDDPEIRRALRTLYRKFHKVLTGYVRDHRLRRGVQCSVPDEETAWALIGLGSIFDIQHDLGIGALKDRRQTLATVSRCLLNGH